MGDQMGSPGGGGPQFYQAQRGWGPPEGAVSGRGGTWMPGQQGQSSQMLQPIPGMSGGFVGQNGPGMSGSPDKMGAPMGGTGQWGPPARSLYNPVNPMANQQPWGQQGLMADTRTPEQRAAGEALHQQYMANGGSVYGQQRQMGAGAVPGMGPQAGPTPQPGYATRAERDAAGWGHAAYTPPAAPTLNTSAEVQGAPAPAGPSRLEMWQQKYKAMGTRPTQNVGPVGAPRTNGGR